MRHLVVFALAALVAAPALAQTKPAKAPAPAKGPGQKYLSVNPDAGLSANAPQRYSLKDCSNFLKWNPQLGNAAEASLVTWCLAHTRGAAVRKQLLVDLHVYGWFDGYGARMNQDTPLAGADQCRKINRMVGLDVWKTLHDEARGIDAALRAYGKMSHSEQLELKNEAQDCIARGEDADRRGASILLANILQEEAFNLGWNQAWNHAWNGGWDHGVKAQLAEDKKALENAISKDADRYNALVKDYNALAAQFHKATLPQPHGFWASLALALASRGGPAGGSAMSDATCTEEIGAWPTTFNCGSTTCVREVGAWPATFDCH
jgi:hypothetical protein